MFFVYRDIVSRMTRLLEEGMVSFTSVPEGQN
jgi:hypothetical protein